MQNVSYARAGKVLLSEFNLTLPDPGAYVISGGVGSGKSLLCGLLSGRLKPGSGKILIDGDHVRNATVAGATVLEARSGDRCDYSERIVDFLESELSIAGGSPKLLDPYRNILVEKFDIGPNGLMTALSYGQQLLVQVILAACSPCRIAILDGHLSYFDEPTATMARQLLQNSIEEFEKFIVLTSTRLSPGTVAEEQTIVLSGAIPVALVSADSDTQQHEDA